MAVTVYPDGEISEWIYEEIGAFIETGDTSVDDETTEREVATLRRKRDVCCLNGFTEEVGTVIAAGAEYFDISGTACKDYDPLNPVYVIFSDPMKCTQNTLEQVQDDQGRVKWQEYQVWEFFNNRTTTVGPAPPP